jgi:lysophospholipase L1-like esterase
MVVLKISYCTVGFTTEISVAIQTSTAPRRSKIAAPACAGRHEFLNRLLTERSFMDCARSNQYDSKSGESVAKTVKIVMLGDSITFGGQWQELLGKNLLVNFGICGDTTEGMRQRISEVCACNPSVCFVMGGINDIFCGVSEAAIAANIQHIVDLLEKHSVQAIVQSVVLVSTLVEGWETINTKVHAVNEKLQKFCAQNNVPFVDVNSVLCGDALKSEYTEDGVHLRESAYFEWAKLINCKINN